MIIKPEHIIIIMVSISLGLGYMYLRSGWQLLAVANRWLRWLIFSFLFAWVGQLLDIHNPKPFALLASTGFLVYLLIETIYNWIAISALSKSELALFPTFRSNKDGDEWPSHHRYLKTKEWIRQNGFTRIQSIKAMLDEQLSIRASVYENKEKKVRLQVLFVPQRNESLAMCYVFSSKDEDEARYITDNMFLPFGGFYPESWHLIRKPMVRSISKLFARHKKRL